nr:MAG TPA: hypothetical protein [Caudoviricetes sp.]
MKFIQHTNKHAFGEEVSSTSSPISCRILKVHFYMFWNFYINH